MKQGSGLWVGNEKFEGYYADLIGAIARAAGFDYELRLVPDGKIGMNISNSWNGIIGEIVRGVRILVMKNRIINSNKEDIKYLDREKVKYKIA